MKKVFYYLIAVVLLQITSCKKETNGNTTTVKVVPIAPTTLTGQAVSTSKINLAWTDNSTNEDGFKIERKLANGTHALIATTAVNITNYTDSSLIANTTYIYRVYAFNAAGNSLTYTNEFTVTTNSIVVPIPLAPSNLYSNPSTILPDKIMLNWTDNSTNEDGFKIERKLANGTYAVIATTAVNITNYTDSNLIANTAYTYRVYAFNAAGNSLTYTNELTLSTQNNVAPINLTVNATVSADSSGNVAFVASATNATSYDYDYGDGTFATVPSGVSNYKYSTSGTYSVNVIAKNASGLTTSKSIQVTVKVVTSVFWSEEFNTNGAPDPAKWGYDLGAGGWGNNELQYYTARPENAIVQGGVLKIKLIKESYNGSNYTSARLISKNKFAFKYGKVDIMAKLPAGGGTWPALWMLGSNITNAGWPDCGEIDIMEHKGNELNKIYGTLHYPGRFGGNGNGGTTTIANATTQFHKYSLDWSATAIKIYVDDVLYHTVANSNAIPFNHDFFFILNVAMGGNFGGTVDPAFTNATMEIDYIRVYK